MKKRTTIKGFTVSTAPMGAWDGRSETMVFDASGEEVDSIRVPMHKARAAHRHFVGLYKLGALANYYRSSVGESAQRAALRVD